MRRESQVGWSDWDNLGCGEVEFLEQNEQRIHLGGVWEDAVDALGVEGGEGRFPETFELNGTINGDV